MRAMAMHGLLLARRSAGAKLLVFKRSAFRTFCGFSVLSFVWAGLMHIIKVESHSHAQGAHRPDPGRNLSSINAGLLSFRLTQ